MAIVIRHARLDAQSELDETARILVAAFEQYRPAADAGVTPERREAFARYLADVGDVRSRLDCAELFIAEDAGRIVGTATFYPPKRAVSYPTTVAFEHWPRTWAALRLLAVDPAHRGRGIARMLTEARIRRARDLGAPAVALHTTPGFEVARSMVRRMGWQRAPDYDYWPLPDVRAEAYALSLT